MTIHYPDYPPEWTPLANDAADSSFRGNPMSMFYEGGRVGTKPISIRVPKPPQEHAKGGLAHAAKEVADAGVGGDELIIHINRDEFEQLKKEWGEPTINPHTGMPQFTPFWKQKWFAPVAAIGSAALMATGLGAPLGAALLPASLAGETIAGAALPSIVGNALIGAGTGALTGGSKGALLGGALGGLGTIGAGALGSTGAGVTSQGQEGLSGWWSRMGSGDYFTAGLAAKPGFDAAAYQAAGSPLPVPRPEAIGSIAGMGEGAATGAAKAATEGGLLASMSKPSFLLPAAVLGAAALGGGKPPQLPTQAAAAPSSDPNLTRRLDMAPLSRPRRQGPQNYYTYGAGPETAYYDEPVQAATGGPLSRFVQGGGTGRSDSIDARLSDGEYVVDAETVSLLGDGSSKAGAKKLDQFRANIRKQKGKQLAKGKFSPDAKSPEEYV